MNEKQYLEHLEKLWEKNWPTGVPKEIDYPLGKMPITSYLKEYAKQIPDKPSVIFYGREITYGELDVLSDKFASYLSSKGLAKGDRVAVFLLNCPQFFIAFYGILKLGCIYVPVNPLFKEHEFIHEMNDAQPKVIICLDFLYPLVEKTRAQIAIEEIIVTRLTDYLPETPPLPFPDIFNLSGQKCPDTVDFVSILKSRGMDDYPDPHITLDDIAAINYTGGTTGLPKGCVHTQWDMLCTGAAAGINLKTEDDAIDHDVSLAIMPSFWIAGELYLIIPILNGSTVVYLTRWDAKTALMAIDRYKIAHISGTVDLIVELMDHPDFHQFDLSSLKTTMTNSFVKKLNSDYRRRWKALTGITMREASYGMTETHTLDTFTNHMQDDDMDLRSQPVFVGMPMPGTKFKIVDFESEELLPLGKEGEIVIKTSTLMKSYWRNPEATEKALKDGWYRTGDIGMIDENGYLHYMGRNKEMIKVKGMSVFPSEIEIILGRHPAVEGSGVISMEDPQKGEIPVAFVKLKKEFFGKMTEEDLSAWSRENMAVYKVPRIRIVEALPLSATGKVLKEELKTFL